MREQWTSPISIRHPTARLHAFNFSLPRLLLFGTHEFLFLISCASLSGPQGEISLGASFCFSAARVTRPVLITTVDRQALALRAAPQAVTQTYEARTCYRSLAISGSRRNWIGEIHMFVKYEYMRFEKSLIQSDWKLHKIAIHFLNIVEIIFPNPLEMRGILLSFGSLPLD